MAYYREMERLSNKRKDFRNMTEIERTELVMDWKDYVDKVKADRSWADTEEAQSKYQKLLDRTFNGVGL